MSIADAITNLVELVTTHLSVVEPKVQVFDGQPIEMAPLECIVIGMSAEDLATDGTINIAGLYSSEETFDINCLIKCWSGDVDVVPLRQRAVHLYQLVKEQVETNLTLKGATTLARVASVQYSPVRFDGGTAVNMAFRVRCRTLTR